MFYAGREYAGKSPVYALGTLPIPESRGSQALTSRFIVSWIGEGIKLENPAPFIVSPPIIRL